METEGPFACDLCGKPAVEITGDVADNLTLCYGCRYKLRSGQWRADALLGGGYVLARVAGWPQAGEKTIVITEDAHGRT